MCSLKPALRRQKKFNCHARQHGSVGSRRLHTDGACVARLLLLNASTMHEEQRSKGGKKTTVESGGVWIEEETETGRHATHTHTVCT